VSTDTTAIGGDVVYWISVPHFVAEMSDAVRRWWAQYGDTATVQRNYARYARRRPEGLPPHVGGVVVIA